MEEELVIKQEEELVIEQQPFLPPSLSGLSSLTTLDISNRYLSNNDISINLGSLSSLQDLNLAGNDFSELPAGIGHLVKLEKLDLSDCPNILFISEIPSSLRALVAPIEVARWTGPFLSITFPTCFSLCSARPDISSRKKKDDTELFYTRPKISSRHEVEDADHSWVIYIPFSRIQGAIEGGDELEVSVKPDDNTILKKCTIVSKL
ncbi:hypothetical protein NC651_029895 [Populus alba x Populus x berolinensis]|nr:hypothetical protein NC651_029895 [Populus alba x Populus x berolinensis]